MSLSVSVFVRDPDTGDMHSNPLEIPPSETCLPVGFETTRKSFWGHEIMREMGLEILPQLLYEGWLIIENDTLDQVESEVLKIRENQALISETTGWDKDFVMSRTKNILRALSTARQVGGGIDFG